MGEAICCPARIELDQQVPVLSGPRIGLDVGVGIAGIEGDEFRGSLDRDPPRRLPRRRIEDEQIPAHADPQQPVGLCREGAGDRGQRDLLHDAKR